MAYYLYLIGCHHLWQYLKCLYSLLYYLISAMLCLSGGPSLSYDSQSRVEKLFNRAVGAVYGLRKFDHVCALRKLEWLFVQSLIQHHCVLYQHYHAETENIILFIYQFNLVDNRIMRPVYVCMYVWWCIRVYVCIYACMYVSGCISYCMCVPFGRLEQLSQLFRGNNQIINQS